MNKKIAFTLVATPTSQIKQNYYSGLNKLLINKGLTNQEYNQKIAQIFDNYSQK